MTQGLFALFKGDSGAGKTVGALSFPEPIILDHDRKMPAIARKHFPNRKFDWIQYESVLDYGDLIDRWKSEGCPYKTIICDSVTSLSASCLKTIDDLKGQNILNSMRSIKATKSGGQMVELRGYDYYNAEDSFIKYYLDGLKTLWARPGNPQHVIMIAHVLTSESTDIKTKTVTRTRRIVTAGKGIAAYIPAQFDDVFHFGVAHGDILADDDSAKVRHLCFTEAIGEDFAKTAYRLPYRLDYTGGSLYDLISSEVEPQTETEPSKPARKLLNI